MPMFRRPVLVLAAIALAVLFAGAMLFHDTEEAVPLDAGVRPAEEQQITVYVSGAVAKPGVVAMKKTELVLTGRNAPEWLMERADLVTEMREVKHYYQKGVEARKGIEN